MELESSSYIASGELFDFVDTQLRCSNGVMATVVAIHSGIATVLKLVRHNQDP